MTEIETDANGRRVYLPDGEILRQYLADDSHVSIIVGPLGSGTSTASCMKIYRLAMSQNAGPDGVRRMRWAIVRNTYPELTGTTLETWLTWFPEETYGRLNRSRPMRQAFKIGDVEMDVWFLALDGPEDIKKLRSAEFTGIWFNELEFHDKPIFDEAESRTGRYPSVMNGGSRWHGVIADMNAPNEDHWVPKLAGLVALPDDIPEDERKDWVWPDDPDPMKKWTLFRQPAALLEVMGEDRKTVIGYRVNPKAENVRWLKGGADFYMEKSRGKSKRWIDSRLMNKITVYTEGKPVWPSFREDVHVSGVKLRANPNYPLVIGMDFGRRPCAVIGQEINGRIRLFAEVRGYDMGATTFAPILKRYLTQNFPNFRFAIYGDPKGQDKTQSDEKTAYQIFASHGLPVMAAPCPTNSIELRLGAVEQVLNEMIDGVPRFMIDPMDCQTAKMAMAGKYCFGEKAGGGHHDEPLKNKYSDVADAIQYLCLGVGEGRRIVGLTAEGMRGRIRVGTPPSRRKVR